MTPFYRNIEETRPIALHREEIEELVALFSHTPDETVAIKIVYKGRKKSLCFTDLHEIEAQAHLPRTATLDLSITVRRDDQVLRGATFEFYQNITHYQIHSLDAAWLAPMKETLSAFFRRNTPWYAPILKILPLLAPVPILVAGHNAFTSVYEKPVAITLLWSILTLGSILFYGLAYTGKIFPPISICFSGKRE